MPEALWDFSLRVYGRPAVREACLELQDRLGADVNMLLWAAWCALDRRHPVSVGDVTAARSLLTPWSAGVIAPLRVARRALKPAAIIDPAAAVLRARLQGLELDAEHTAQHRLATLPIPFGSADGVLIANLEAAAPPGAHIGPLATALTEEPPPLAPPVSP